MKNLKYFTTVLLLMVMGQVKAQTDQATTIKIVEAQNFTFNANTAIPLSNSDVSRVLSSMAGAQSTSSINLSGSSYDVKVTKDSVVAYLPYYGRSYRPSMNSSEGGIKFTSKKFSYSQTKNKKGAYYIRIDTKDQKSENYQLILNISKNGYASLMVISNNKQSINFNGYLSEIKTD